MVEAITVVRSLHIFFAILWAGAALHYQAVSRKQFTEDGALMRFLADSKHGPYLGATALGTFIFGSATWAINGGDAYTLTSNMILGFGALGASLGLAVGFMGHLPNSLRIKKALADGADATLARLAKRERVMDRLSMAGIGLGLLAMITFRWF